MGVPRTSEIETKTQLSVDFEELLSDGDSAFSDFHIEHEGKYFHLHKAILAGTWNDYFVLTLWNDVYEFDLILLKCFSHFSTMSSC